MVFEEKLLYEFKMKDTYFLILHLFNFYLLFFWDILTGASKLQPAGCSPVLVNKILLEHSHAL